MKFNYTNILLFSLSLNILFLSSQVYNQRNHYITHHTLKPSTRLLCECELYTSIYDNDPEIQKVMENFNKQTQQRFEEYDERMQEKRQKCKEQCDKEIQQIILKDKMEKQMAQQLTTLETKIDTNDIPTCICEKSLADKVEKGCLRCGGVLGGGVMPGFGAIGGTALYALNQLRPTAIATAIEAALNAGATKIAAAGIEAGEAAGMEFVIKALKHYGVQKIVPEIGEKISSTGHYANITNFVNFINSEYGPTCTSLLSNFEAPAACNTFETKLSIKTVGAGTDGYPSRYAIQKLLDFLARKAETNANYEAANVSSKIAAKITEQQTAAINATYTSWQIAITASIVAILVIVLIMVIIYLILRYRRKKKMKKKLQYIKLLEE